MKKVELLCPAGNKKMLEMAIHNGADAVYLSGLNFGARKFSNNFNDEEIIEAINYAHLYGVKVYVTANTLIKDNEVEDFLKFIELIHKNNVDAVLMQDLGMIDLVRKTFPNLEIHASTQFHNHNKEGLKFLKEIGVKRAVLARELSIDEIRELDIDIEKEVFVHGALCISYSGQCLMSSLVMNRSGNRGECAGMCRLPYKLLKNGKNIETNGEYLLSPKELCTIRYIDQILSSNIESIKIEGRMKSPEYVGFVTRLYRTAIDNYYDNKPINIKEEDIEKLKLLYNRGFTKGYILNDSNIINQYTPNHIGIEIGKVIDITKNKIAIKLDKKLRQGDAIRFKNSNKGMYINFIYNKKNNLINYGEEQQIIYIDNKINLDKNDIVLKTIDNTLLEEINNYPPKKIPITIEIYAHLNKPLKITFNDGNNIVNIEGNKVFEAKTQAVSEENIKEKISKLGNTIYKVTNVSVDMDKNIFIPIKEINELRRTLVEKLNNLRITPKKEFIKNKYYYRNIENIVTNKLSILLEDEKDYIKYKDNKNIDFYTEDIKLYLKHKNNRNIFLRLPRALNQIKDYKNDMLLINDIGSINKYSKENLIYSDIYSNVTNSFTVKCLTELGVKKIGISPELSKEEINFLCSSYLNNFKAKPNIEVPIYGKYELMLLKHCILKENISGKASCNICKNDGKYYLKDRNNEQYRLLNKNCKTTILNYKATNKVEDFKDYKYINYYISLIDISKNEKNKISEYIKEW